MGLEVAKIRAKDHNPFSRKSAYPSDLNLVKGLSWTVGMVTRFGSKPYLEFGYAKAFE